MGFNGLVALVLQRTTPPNKKYKVNGRTIMEPTSPEGSAQLAAAERLVADYTEVLQSVTALLATGAPDTLLPAAREDIRQAFQTVLRHHSDTGLCGATIDIDSLRNRYLSLASFLPYDEANAAIRLQTAFERGDRSYLATRAAQQAIARSRQIEQDASLLASEFDTMLRTRESGDLLSEIDALLAELDRKFVAAPDG